MKLHDQALNTIIAAAMAEGRIRALKPPSVAMLDADGHVMAFKRSAGASTRRQQVAWGKMCGVLGLGVSSQKS